jgi:hypothetical protein
MISKGCLVRLKRHKHIECEEPGVYIAISDPYHPDGEAPWYPTGWRGSKFGMQTTNQSLQAIDILIDNVVTPTVLDALEKVQ